MFDFFATGFDDIQPMGDWTIFYDCDLKSKFKNLIPNVESSQKFNLILSLTHTYFQVQREDKDGKLLETLHFSIKDIDMANFNLEKVTNEK